MIKIKRIIWITAGIVVIIAIIISYPSIKKQFVMKQIKEIQSQETVVKDEPDKEEPEDDDETEEADSKKKDDPIRDFLTEKVDKAVKRYFKNDLKIVAIGDSLTEGVGDEAENGGYVGILENTINQDKELIDIENLGKRGNRTDQLIARMQEPEIEASLKEADIILITIGANDIMQIFKENFTDLTLDKFNIGQINYEKRLDYILTAMEENNPNADIYLIGFYNPFKKYFADIEELEVIINGWNGISEDIVNEHDQTKYVPIKDLFENTTINYFSSDNFHPNHLGYELMAERVLEYLVDEGESDEQEE